MADLDAAGGAATAGLVAGALSRAGGHAGEPHPVCADCGAATLGRFCHNCGNPAHVHRTLLHLGEELLHGVMHFDSRAWRTLPMLVFRPGRLTREWVLGKRARYVSPLAMFLFTIFVMFMALSYLPPAVETRVERRAEAAAETRGVTVSPGTDWKAQVAKGVLAGDIDVATGNPKLDAKIRHKAENPDLAIYKLQQTFYKFSFLLVPISIPFVALLFLWKRGVTLYDHGVFVLYSLTFMSLLAMVLSLTNRLGSAADALALAAPAHLFFQLKGAYGLGWRGAAWRTVLLLAFCLVALAIFALSVIWLGLG